MKIMKKTFPIIILVFLFSGIFASGGNPGGEVVVHIDGFRNNRGRAAVSLYNSAKGFPGRFENAFQNILAPIKGNKAEARFRGVPPGVYAVISLHDENENEKMDKNFLGMPKEGFGLSGNPRSFLRPPKFRDASFRLTTGTLTLKIRMKYILP